MSLRLSLEIPTAYLEEWSLWTDLDFVLAHRVLEDEAYAEFYARRPSDRELILDNSMHELGAPLSIEAIRDAAERVHADYVIPPDRLGEPEWNLLQYAQTCRVCSDFNVAGVLCGRDMAERRSVLDHIQGAPMLLLPFREPRLTWFLELETPIRRRFENKRIHLLGVNTLTELQCFAGYSSDERSIWSVDTSKPIKHGVVHRNIRDGSLRGAALSSKDLLDLHSLTSAQIESVAANVLVLREFLE